VALVQNNIRRPRQNPRLFKSPSGIVFSENIKGRSPGRGVLRDQTVKPFASRTLGKAAVQDKREPAFSRGIQLKEQERSEYVRDHGPELIALLAEQHRRTGNSIARLAGELLQELLLLYKTEDDGRALERQSAPPPEINTGDPASITAIVGIHTTQNTPGLRRGDIEGVLRILQTYGEAAEIGPLADEEPVVTHDPNGSGEGSRLWRFVPQ